VEKSKNSVFSLQRIPTLGPPFGKWEKGSGERRRMGEIMELCIRSSGDRSQAVPPSAQGSRCRTTLTPVVSPMNRSTEFPVKHSSLFPSLPNANSNQRNRNRIEKFIIKIWKATHFPFVWVILFPFLFPS